MGQNDVTQKLLDKIESIQTDVSIIKTKLEEREKLENAYDHEGRIKSLELWRAEQQGVSGFIQRWGPVVISGAIGLYVAFRG